MCQLLDTILIQKGYTYSVALDGIQHILDDQVRTTGREREWRGDTYHAGHHAADDGETDDGCEVHHAIHETFLVQLREAFIT